MSTTTSPNESIEKRRAACERLKERIRSDPAARVEDELADGPDLAEDDDAIIALIMAEMNARRGVGLPPVPAEAWEERLRLMVADPERRGAIQSLLSTEMVTVHEPSAAHGPMVGVPHRGKVGRYHVLEEIGRGGMGVVYKARQLNPGRLVAVKMILAGEHANARERARLRNEAEATAKLAHPNIVQILDSDYHEGLPFLVMEYVDGGNLAQMLRSTPQSIRWSARLIETLARAIHEAHQAGIVHRDLNPTNILMTQAGTPKIGDFGLAKFLLNDSHHSQSGKILGTPSYMAPEQLADRGLDVDSKTDVYALGAVLYEMLTGMAPFRGLTPMETLCQVAEGEVVPPSRLRHGLPLDLETICLKCLAKKPAARYADALELADDLRRWQDREPIKARRTPRLRRAVQWSLREPLAASLLFVTFVLLMILFGLAAAYSFHIQTRDAEVKFKTMMDYVRKTSQDNAAKEVEHNRRVIRDQQLGRIYEHATAGRAEVAIETFAHLEPVPPHEDSFESRLVDRLIHRTTDVLAGAAHKAAVTRAATSLDGRTLLSGDFDGRVVEWDVDARKSTWTLATDSATAVRGLAVASDGRGHPSAYAAVRVDVDTAVVSVWDKGARRNVGNFPVPIRQVAEVGFARSGSLLAVRGFVGESSTWRTYLFESKDGEWAEAGEVEDTTCMAFTTAGEVAAVGRGDGTAVTLGRPADRNRTLRPPSSSEAVRPTCLAFSADGALLATGWADDRLVVWDLRADSPPTVLGCPDGLPSYVAFCQEGRALVALEGGRTLAVHGLSTGAPRRTLATPAATPARLATSPLGDVLAAGYDSLPVLAWDLDDPSAPCRPISDYHSPSCLQFSPDGSLILNFDQESIFIRKPAESPPARVALAGHPGTEVWSLAFSPDGLTLASGADDHRIKLWDVETGAELLSVEAHEQTVSGLAFSPRTGHLASVSLDGSWKIWRFRREGTGPASLEPLKTLREPGRSQLRCVAYSAPGDQVAASGLAPEILLDMAPDYDAPSAVAGAHSEMITALAFSSSPRNLLATGSCDRRFRLWDPSGVDQIHDKPAEGAVMALAFSDYPNTNNSLLAIGGDQRRITVMDVNDRKTEKPIGEHPASVRALAFSHDGATLATGCDDGEVRLCDVNTRQVVLALKGHRARINAVAFSRGDSTLASASHAGEVFLWRGAPAR